LETNQMVTPDQTAAGRTKSRSLQLLGRLAKNQRGSIGIIAAVSLPALLGFGGLAVDASVWLRAKNGVQGAADAAASSVAAAAVAGGNYLTRLSAEADGVAAANGYQNGANGVVVTLNHPPSSGAYAGNALAYEVIIAAPQQLYLASVFPALTAPTVTGRAVALTTTSPACILALSPASPPNGTVPVNGNAPLNAQNCDVDADSPSANSINTSGGGSISTANIRSVGGVTGSNITASGAIMTNGPYIADPYVGMRSIPPIPPLQPWSQNINWSGRVANPTGVAAFNGNVNVTGQGATLDPGVYLITGSLSGTKPLSGTGVTIVLTSPTPSTDTGSFQFTGGASLNLTAPATGSTAGIALWADSRLPEVQDQFTGSSSSRVVGAIYLPSHDLKYAGNSGNVSPCMQLIAAQITVTGTTTLNHNCANVGTLDPQIKWTLVE
jgi:Flp pilus assembly protein TadG